MKLSDLTVDSLKSDSFMAHYFGLGFIQVKLTDATRLHFYHPELPAFVEEPHNHRYSFRSEVLRGGLGQTFWEPVGAPVAEGALWWVDNETCTSDATQDVPEGYKSFFRYAGETITKDGSSYYLPSEVFHQVRPLFELGPCVTFLTRGPRTKSFAQVARTRREKGICPFSRPISEDLMWQIIEDCLVPPL